MKSERREEEKEEQRYVCARARVCKRHVILDYEIVSFWKIC